MPELPTRNGFGGFTSPSNDDHLRWMLMWHASVVRELMTVEIKRFGLEQAIRNTRKIDRERKKFVQDLLRGIS